MALWAFILLREPVEHLANLPPCFLERQGSWAPVLTALGFDAIRGARLITGALCGLAALGFGGACLSLMVMSGACSIQLLVRESAFYNHAEIPALYALLALCLQGLLANKPVDEKSARVALLEIATAVYLCYALVAAHRLAHGWNWLVDGGMQEAIITGALMPRGMDWDGGTLLLEWPGVWAAIGLLVFASTIIELFAPWATVSRTWCRCFLSWAVLFHLSVAILMDIYFWETLILLPFLWLCPVGKPASELMLCSESEPIGP